MTDHNESFRAIVDQRRAVRVFDKNALFDHAAVTRSLELAIKAPSSSNLQLWEFYRLRSEGIKQRAHAICLNQSAAKTARELCVFVTRKDCWRQRAAFNLETLKEQFGPGKLDKRQKAALKYYDKLIPFVYQEGFFGLFGQAKKLAMASLGLLKPVYRELGSADMTTVVHKSCALAAQTFMLAMVAEGYATCPMEGCDSKRLKKLLNLPKNAQINMVVAVGPADKKGIYGPRSRVPLSQLVHEL